MKEIAVLSDLPTVAVVIAQSRSAGGKGSGFSARNTILHLQAKNGNAKEGGLEAVEFLDGEKQPNAASTTRTVPQYLSRSGGKIRVVRRREHNQKQKNEKNKTL